ncbi:MAG: hypothetical protein R6U89_04205 [Dehalococcoidia bacterium]
MAETIEEFVEKLKAEGVEEGRRQAEQVLREAQQQADRIIADAESKAGDIIAGANKEAESLVSRGHTELELAARDATLKLQDALQRSLMSVIGRAVEEKLNDAEFLKELIQSIVVRYIEADIRGSQSVEIDVSPEMRDRLSEWAINQLRQVTADSSIYVDIKDNLRQAGFEVSFEGATVEITRESVVETLMQLVGPRLREILRKEDTTQD